jgi:hypothetical protein
MNTHGRRCVSACFSRLHDRRKQDQFPLNPEELRERIRLTSTSGGSPGC